MAVHVEQPATVQPPPKNRDSEPASYSCQRRWPRRGTYARVVEVKSQSKVYELVAVAAVAAAASTSATRVPVISAEKGPAWPRNEAVGDAITEVVAGLPDSAVLPKTDSVRPALGASAAAERTQHSAASTEIMSGRGR